MRPIVNLGKASRITFKATHAPRSRSLPAQHTVMSFRPVNYHLQRLHRVKLTNLPIISTLHDVWCPRIVFSCQLPCLTVFSADSNFVKVFKALHTNVKACPCSPVMISCEPW